MIAWQRDLPDARRFWPALCTGDGSLIGILSSGGLGQMAYAIPIWTVMKAFDLSFPGTKVLAKHSIGKLD
jgi:hypothetical protein